MKNIKLFLFFTALAVLFVHACTDENDPSFPQEEQEAAVEQARQLYESTITGYTRMHSVVENGSMMVKPEWRFSTVKQNAEYLTVEIELFAESFFSFVMPENMEKFKSTKQKKYLLSKTNFVFRNNRNTGKSEMFLMTVVPDVKYLESTSFRPFKKMSYLKRDPRFSGMVFYHNLSGEFVNGCRYIDGVVSSSIMATEKNEFSMTTTRASEEECRDWYMLYYVEECWEWGLSNGEVTGSECSYSFEFEYWYTECSGGDGGYQGGNEGGGGGGSAPGGNIITTYAKENVPQTMPVQLPNACVTSIMEYMSKIFGKNRNEGEFILWYFQTYSKLVSDNGVSLAHIRPFTDHFFTTSNNLDFQSAINKGYLIMTDISSNISNSAHNVLIVGYTSNGDYIYMDPQKGTFQKALGSHFGKNYAIFITGEK